ncbi:MAG TPA: YcxB family protein, partial [Blastocatellia bacterium]
MAARRQPLHTVAMDEEPRIEIDVQLELRDIVRASRALAFKGKPFLFLAILSCVMLLYAGYSWIEGRSEFQWQALLLPGVVLLISLSPSWVSRRYWTTNKGAREQTHYVFSERGIDSTAPSATSHAEWDRVYGVTEFGKDFLLFWSRHQALMIPKRFFSPEQIQEFRRLL